MSQQQQKEDSVLFSLRNLMEMEDDRIRQQEEATRRAEDEKRRAEEAAIQAEKERTDAIRLAAEEKQRAEEAARRAEEQRVFLQRQEQEIRIKAEEERKARDLELQRQHEHAQKMAELEAKKASEKGLSPVAVAAGALLILGGVSLGGFFGVYRPMQQEQARVAQENRDRAQRADGARA